MKNATLLRTSVETEMCVIQKHAEKTCRVNWLLWSGKGLNFVNHCFSQSDCDDLPLVFGNWSSFRKRHDVPDINSEVSFSVHLLSQKICQVTKMKRRVQRIVAEF